MASILPGFEYDIFISYRQKDNKYDGWVTEFVTNLRKELEATLKEDVSIYFDENPHDGLLETHHVDKSLEGKLKCVIFIPILSHTYCDPKSFAWNNEFLVFCKLARTDSIGLDVRLTNKNVASRVLPVQIHDLDDKDRALFEKESGMPLRSIDFIFKSHGVNRPLTSNDTRSDNLNRTFYRDQINKTANAIEQIISSLARKEAEFSEEVHYPSRPSPSRPWRSWVWSEILRRNVIRAAFTYIIVALLLHQLLIFLTPFLRLEERAVHLASWVLAVGFPLAALFAWFYEVSPHGIIRTTSPQAEANPFPPYRKKPLTSKPLVSILILGLILQYVYFSYIRPPFSPPENKIISIAVLPFENRSGDNKDQYIADGITDDIINRLTIISKLKVTNQGKVQQYISKIRITNRGKIQPYQGQVLPFDDMAKSLEVTILLIGSVERHGNQFAIRAQLIDEKNTYLWGNTFHRTAENIIALQSEIAQAIADQLDLQLNDMEKERLHLKATENATAYDYYLRGRSLYYKYTPAANDSAIDQFKRAIALDPKYARAWAGLGDAFAQIHGRFGGELSWTDSSLKASARAIALDSTQSEAYKAMATAYNYKEQYDKAFPLLLKSVELNPTNDQAVGNLGTNYLLRGDLLNALLWEKKGVGMNPKNWIPYQIIGWTYRLLGDLSEAESWLKKSLELNPNVYDTYELLGYTYVAQGRKQVALDLIPRLLEIGTKESRVLETAGLIAHFAGDTKAAKMYFQQSIENNPKYKEDLNTFSPLGLGQILLEEGNKVEADVYLSHEMDILMDRKKSGSQSDELAFSIARIYAIRGNKEQSLAWLQNAIDLNWVDLAKLEYGPYFIGLKTDPEFTNKINYVRLKIAAMRSKDKN